MSENIYTALMAAQKEFPAIKKNKTAKMGSYSYTYADLAGVVDGVMATLHKHGLVFYQIGVIDNNRQILRTILQLTPLLQLDKSQRTIESDFLLPDCPDPQDAGGAITFFRRYALVTLLGIVTEDDTDGQQKSKPKFNPTYPEGMPSAMQKMPVAPPLDEWPPSDIPHSVAAQVPPNHKCGSRMMLSKYPNKVTGKIDWYCAKCKESVPQ